MNYTVIFVTRPEMRRTVEEMKMVYSPSVEDAVSMAKSLGKESLTVIPNGISVIVRE